MAAPRLHHPITPGPDGFIHPSGRIAPVEQAPCPAGPGNQTYQTSPAAQAADSNSACASTVLTASSCRSGG